MSRVEAATRAATQGTLATMIVLTAYVHCRRIIPASHCQIAGTDTYTSSDRTIDVPQQECLKVSVLYVIFSFTVG
jgi:hypothetical protein